MTDDNQTVRCPQCEIYRAEIELLKRKTSQGFLWIVLGPALLACCFLLLLRYRPFESTAISWLAYFVLGIQMGSCFGAFYFAAAAALLINSEGWKKAIAFTAFAVILCSNLQWLLNENDDIEILMMHAWILLPVMLLPALWCIWRNQATLSIGGKPENQHPISIGTLVWLTGWSAVYLMLLRLVLEKVDLDDIKIYCSIFLPLGLAMGNWGVRFLIRECTLKLRSAIWLVLTTLALVVASSGYIYLNVMGTGLVDVVNLWEFGLTLIISSTSIVIAGRWWLSLVFSETRLR